MVNTIFKQPLQKLKKNNIEHIIFYFTAKIDFL